MAKINKISVGGTPSLPRLSDSALLEQAKTSFAKDTEPPKEELLPKLVAEKKKMTYLN